VFCICRYVFSIPRLEDRPVMPVERIGLMLMASAFEPVSISVTGSEPTDLPARWDADFKKAESPKAIQNGSLISKL
jgi:primary-amine oxidase